MKILEYKNIMGSLDFDNDDNIYFGTIQNVKGSFMYHGSTLSEVKNNFKDTVNLYLDYCKELNINPNNVELIRL